MTYKEIIKKKAYFRNITWIHLSNCLKAFENRELLSASIWAAVFVESILKDMLTELLGINVSMEEISALISRLRNTLNNGTSKLELASGDQAKIEDIIRRADEIRLKRNRLVHDTGIENNYLDSDADDIYKNVNLIIERYLKTKVSKCVFRKNKETDQETLCIKNEPDFPMFISTITPHTFEQSEFIEEFCGRLKSIGIKPVRCVMNDFDRKNPMDKARRYIEKCHGIIVLGLERSHAYFYRDKEGSDIESENMHRRYSSAWLQLETGMAIGMGKDVFVLCQKNLYSEGIFDRNWNSYIPVELNLPLDINDPVVTEIIHVLEEYKEEVEANSSASAT
jgi:HEPN domain-containing protein